MNDNIKMNKISEETGEAIKDDVKKKKKSLNVGFLFLKIVIALALIVVVAYFGFTFTLKEGESAVVLQFGRKRAVYTTCPDEGENSDAGLHFRLPWPFEEVYKYDGRERYVESNNLQVLTKSVKAEEGQEASKDEEASTPIIFQTYAMWKVSDPVKYHNQVSKGGEESVVSGIKTNLFNATQIVIGNYTISEIISLDEEKLKTDEIQQQIFDRVYENCKKTYGIEIVDVSMLRIMYPDGTRESIFAKINEDRNTEAQKIKDEAFVKAEAIKDAANEEKSRLEGEGEKEASDIRTQTEKDVAKIYADAQAANIELFKFLKELDTIVNSVNQNSVLVVDANSYPFNILLDYSDKLEGDEATVVENLTEVLAELPEKERNDLITAIEELLSKANKGEATPDTEGTTPPDANGTTTPNANGTTTSDANGASSEEGT